MCSTATAARDLSGQHTAEGAVGNRWGPAQDARLDRCSFLSRFLPSFLSFFLSFFLPAFFFFFFSFLFPFLFFFSLFFSSSYFFFFFLFPFLPPPPPPPHCNDEWQRIVTNDVMEFRFRLHVFTGRRPHLITTSGTVPVLTKPRNYGTCGQVGGELNTTPQYGPSLPAGPKALGPPPCRSQLGWKHTESLGWDSNP